MFRNVLVANRGKIARRAMRTARRNPAAFHLDERSALMRRKKKD